MALYRYATVGDLEMTLRLQATKKSYGYRDLYHASDECSPEKAGDS
jgi:hypothetical protein